MIATCPRIRSFAVRLLLAAGLLITLATSAPVPATLEGTATHVLGADESVHVSVTVNASLAAAMDELEITFNSEIGDGGAMPEIRIIPDDKSLAVQTFSGSTSPPVRTRCKGPGGCVVGYSIELVDSDTALDITVSGVAREGGVGGLGCSAREGELPADGTIEVSFDEP